MYDLWRYGRDQRKAGVWVSGDNQVVDRGFRDDMLADCDQRVVGRPECQAMTYVYEFFVKQFGTAAAQDEPIVSSFPTPKPVRTPGPNDPLPNPQPGPSPSPPPTYRGGTW